MRISGVDALGEAFEESTEALDVSRRGLSFLTSREIPVLASLTVVIPGRGTPQPGEGPRDFLASACVVRMTKENEMNRVAIRFIGATLPFYTPETS